MRLRSAFAHCAASLVVSGGWAVAEPLSDPESGFAVDPPPGYTATIIPPRDKYSVGFEVKKADDDKDTGCQVAFQPAPQNADLSQQEINDLATSPEWIDLARSTLSLVYDVRSADPFEHAGVRGLALVGDFKTEIDAPRAHEVRSLLIILETPKGRVTVVCVGEKTTFDARRPEFESVARATTLPR